MRLEQLVLFGPSDDFRVHFGPGLTVLAGLVPEERSELLSTLSEAMAGRLPNASLVYADPDGRRVFADRTGATFADSGAAAPTLSSMFGTDPNVVTHAHREVRRRGRPLDLARPEARPGPSP